MPLLKDGWHAVLSGCPLQSGTTMVFVVVIVIVVTVVAVAVVVVVRVVTVVAVTVVAGLAFVVVFAAVVFPAVVVVLAAVVLAGVVLAPSTAVVVLSEDGAVVVVGFAVVGFAVVVGLPVVVSVHWRHSSHVYGQNICTDACAHELGARKLTRRGQLTWSLALQQGAVVVWVVTVLVVVGGLVLPGFFGGPPSIPPPQPQHALVAALPFLPAYTLKLWRLVSFPHAGPGEPSRLHRRYFHLGSSGRE